MSTFDFSTAASSNSNSTNINASQSNGNQHDNNNISFDPNEVRHVVLTRAAARFGRLFLRDPTTLVEPKLLRQLTTTIRTTAALGHRSSIVLWGPPQGGKRSTLEALSQIFCVTVENRGATVSGGNGGGVGLTVHRHPQNSSAATLGNHHHQLQHQQQQHGNPSSRLSEKNNNNNNNNNLHNNGNAGQTRGIPILGVVLDGTALRSDHDAAQQCLNALYDFWWLAAMVRSRELKRLQGDSAAVMLQAQQPTNQTRTTIATKTKISSIKRRTQAGKRSKSSNKKVGQGGTRRNCASDVSDDSDDSGDDDGASSSTSTVSRDSSDKPQTGGGRGGRGRGRVGARTTAKSASSATNGGAPLTQQQNQNQQPVASGVPHWAIQADELLNWLFTEALPESMHKQAPPTSTAAATTTSSCNSSSSSNNNNNSSSSDLFASHHNHNHNNSNAFRSAIQQTFRVFTHGGSTVLTALQTTLLELSKAGVSPCFLIHDIRLLGQNCDKILYMISGLLHEQEVLANSSANQHHNSNSTNNGNATFTFDSTTTSMMNALISSSSSSSVAANQSSSSFCGGGLSIVMTSPNPDLRLEKRLSSRMNCDYFFCPQIIPSFVVCLGCCFKPLTENLDTNEAVNFCLPWAAEDASVRHVRGANSSSSSSSSLMTTATTTSNSANAQAEHQQQQQQQQQDLLQRGPIASVVVPANGNQTRAPVSTTTTTKTTTVPPAPSSTTTTSSSSLTLQQQQALLARRRLRAADDPRLAFMDAVKEMEEEIVSLFFDESVAEIRNQQQQHDGTSSTTRTARVMHPLRALYVDFTRKCEQLSRPAHIVRRLIESWFELAFESCHVILPPSSSAPTSSTSFQTQQQQQRQQQGVDIFNDPRFFITGDLIEKACFGYSETVATTAATGAAMMLKDQVSYSSSSSTVTQSSLADSYFFHNVPSSSVTAGPLRPLESFALFGPSNAMPRECVGLLACLVSAVSQQRRGAPNAQIRTLQEHFSIFQELRPPKAASGVSTSSSTAAAAAAAASFAGDSSSSSSSIDSIESWLKAAGLLRRWGIVRAWNSNAASSWGSSSSINSANVASSLTTTSKLDLEIENVEALTMLVNKSIPIVYDTAMGQCVRALLR